MSEDDPKAPRARPPDPEPSRVDRDRLPRPEAHDPHEPASPRPPSGPTDWRTWISRGLIAAGVIVVIGVFLNVISGGGNNTPAPVTTPAVPEGGGAASNPAIESPTSETPAVTTPPAPPKPKSPPPKLLWHREFTTDINTSFNLDRHHIANDPSGFEVTDAGAPSEGLQTVSGTREALWTRRKQPTLRGCIGALGGSGVENIPLTTPGRWICVETLEGLVGTLRFDSVSGGANAGEAMPYTFYVTLYQK